MFHSVKLTFMAEIDVLALIMAWWITFTVVMTLIMCLGFGPRGIIAGKQSL